MIVSEGKGGGSKDWKIKIKWIITISNQNNSNIFIFRYVHLYSTFDIFNEDMVGLDLNHWNSGKWENSA